MSLPTNVLPDTELIDALREDLTAAGIPARREVATVSPEYRFNSVPSRPAIQTGIPEFERKDTDGDEEMPDSELPESELPISDYSRYGNESDIEMSESPLQRPYDHQDNPLIKVSQQIEDYEPQPTTPSDASYQDNDDENEGFSEFEESIIIPNLQSSHANPASPLPPPQSKPRMRDSLGFEGFGDDELLAEQVNRTRQSLDNINLQGLIRLCQLWLQPTFRQKSHLRSRETSSGTLLGL